MEKFIVTTHYGFYTKDGSFKNAVWGKVLLQEGQFVIGNNGKEIAIKTDNIIAVLRCDEKPVELGELGLPILLETELNIYIAE